MLRGDDLTVNMSQIKQLDDGYNPPERLRWVAGNAIWYYSITPLA
jgi:hypothetical protein